MSAKISAVADVYDSLTSKRVYKEAYFHEADVGIIHNEKEHHFDPDIVVGSFNRFKPV